MSSVLALMLATFTVAQGDAFRLDYPHLDGLEKIEVGWRDRTVPLVRSGDRWVAIIGVDLDRGAGDHPAPVTFTYTDGRTEVRRETVRVTPKEFPLTRLTVEPRFVELNPEDLARSNRESARLGQVFRGSHARHFLERSVRGSDSGRSGQQLRPSARVQRSAAQPAFRRRYIGNRRHAHTLHEPRPGRRDRRLFFQWEHRDRRPRAGRVLGLSSSVPNRRRGGADGGQGRSPGSGRRHRPCYRASPALGFSNSECPGRSFLTDTYFPITRCSIS